MYVYGNRALSVFRLQIYIGTNENIMQIRKIAFFLNDNSKLTKTYVRMHICVSVVQ